MSFADEWCVAVFKCNAKEVKAVLAEFCSFLQGLDGTKSSHFLIKDRVDDEVVFSFRVMVDPKKKSIVKNKIAYKLGTLLPKEKFEVESNPENPLYMYVGWSPEKVIAQSGLERFDNLVDLLCCMSKLTLKLIQKEQFDSNQRVELAHAMIGMLGLTVYGSLSAKGMEIGYYDRIEDKYLPHLREDFPENQSSK
ncbi:MAG: hypothetical protein ACQCN4_02725 [Candidatus Bathyarchaeia archaeon]|jgi:hypothetical protein